MLALQRLTLSCLSFCVLGLALSGCSGGGSNTNPTSAPTTPTTTNNPTPTLTSLSPATVTAGAAAQTLTITGTSFISTSTVTFKGASHAATYVSATSMTLPLTAADQATAGSFPVVVTNPTPGGGASAAVNLAINNPAPTLASIAPATVVAGSGATTVTLTGTGFVAGSTVTFAGAAVTPTVVSGTSLMISLSAANLMAAGTFPIVVTNPAPGGGSSAAVNLSVTYPVPAISAISPTTISAGSAATTLTVTGTGFSAGSTVTFAGASVAPTIVSGTSLTIPLTAANLVTAGTFPIVVTNPAPGGGASTAVNLTVTASISGLVYKGASVGSTVTAYTVNSDGTSGSTIGSAKTDADGKFTIPLSSMPTGAVRVTAVGGNYVSEFDGTTITGTSSVSALLDAVSGNVTGLVITPASDFINSYAAGQLSSKATTSEVTAHSTAEALIRAYVGLSAKAVIESLVPVFDKPSITSNPDGFTLGLFIGALAALGHTDVPSSPDDIIAALSADISDGVFDGKAFGTPVPLSGAVAAAVWMKGVALASTTPTTLSPTAGTSDMLLALGVYISSGTAIKNAGILPGDVVALESSFFTGVTSCTCTPASSGLSASSSGAMTAYSLAGRQYLIVAARQQGVVVIDITDPTLKSPPINAWPSISAKTFGGADVGGVIAITGLAGYPQVLAYAYQSKTIAVLNLNTLITGNPATDNPVDITTSLSLKATSPVGFSGGSAYIAGGIPDTGRLGVWLDTADGYGLLSLTALPSASTTSPVALTQLFIVDPASGQEVAENVGGDVANSQLLGGNYRGIHLMELGKGKSYYMSSSDVQKVTSSFSGDLIDGNSVDGALRVGILTSEDTPAAAFLNLKTAVETDSASTTTLGTLAPASGGLVQVNLGASYSPVLSGSAVDRISHLVLFMAGYSTDFAVGKLQDPASVAAGATWEGMTDWSFFTINDAATAPLSSYHYATDPHSVGVVVNQTTGTPYGYLFDGTSDSGVVQIDMTNFLALARKGTTGDDAHQPGVDPSTATTTVGGKSGLVLQEFTWTNPTAPIAAIRHTVTQEEFPNQPMLKPQPK